MLMVRTYIAPSRIKDAGLGLFVASRVGAGAVVWRFNELIDRLIAADTVNRLPVHAKAFIEHHGCLVFPRIWLLLGDNARFINHAEPGNIGCDAHDLTTAIERAVDVLEEGTELTQDYKRFSLDFRSRGFFKKSK